VSTDDDSAIMRRRWIQEREQAMGRKTKTKTNPQTSQFPTPPPRKTRPRTTRQTQTTPIPPQGASVSPIGALTDRIAHHEDVPTRGRSYVCWPPGVLLHHLSAPPQGSNFICEFKVANSIGLATPETLARTGKFYLATRNIYRRELVPDVYPSRVSSPKLDFTTALLRNLRTAWNASFAVKASMDGRKMMTRFKNI
jgi:hypothetical protein